MNDKVKIIAGLIIFAVICLTPFLMGLGSDATKGPEPIVSETAKKKGKCVLEKTQMAKQHMVILDQWRNSVVRTGQRVHNTKDGKSFDMSLSNTCLDCHDNKKEFCDRCHNYASVTPYCWDCHIDPKEVK